ncbi:hypothetical protein HCN44_007453 [Aphidius gifuensis]|uniref:Cobalamin adenosyltransferase-like domain-containing protein n=1 Tax=Aphidius gifuensis TaxID=684658 RepID=A0A834XL09_APHGI|nr:hypothetical protein HCN44_007453 [Aphidius gifuensis]
MEFARRLLCRSFYINKTILKSQIRNSNKNGLNIDPKIFMSLQNNTNDIKTINNEIVENAIGTTDELSSYIGLAREFACDSSTEHPYVDKLKRVQMILFDLNNTISRSSVKNKIDLFENKHTKDLDEWITEYSNQLPPAEDYIIPGGGKASASLHVARSICQRAERNVKPLVESGVIDKEAQNYLNHLSNFLLTASRIAAKCDQRTENIYIPRADVPDDKQ